VAGIDLVYYGSFEAAMARSSMQAAGLETPADLAAVFRERTARILRPVFSREELTIYRFEPTGTYP